MDENGQTATTAMLSKETPKQEGKKLPQYLIAVAANLSAFAAGTALAWTSPALPELQSENSTLTVTPEQGSWVGSLLAVGAFTGALPAGFITDIFGRKLVCAALAVPFLLSWLLITYASSVTMLYIARFIAGFATGASSAIAPMYTAEIAESSIRGSLGSFFQLMLTGGILYTYVLGAIVTYDSLAILSGLVPLVFLIAFFNAPETPVYLLRNNKRSEAEKSLRTLRGSSYNINVELNELQNDINKSAQASSSVMELITRKATIKGLIVSLGLMLFQQLSGVNAVIFYSVAIFEAAGSTLHPSIATIIIGVVQVLVTYTSTLLVDRAGRRILLLISDAVMAICLGTLGYYFYLQDSGKDVSNLGLLPLLSVAVFIIVFSIGFGPIPWMMTGELFSSEIKGVATGIAVGLNWCLTFVVTKSFQPLVSSLGSAVTFWIFSAVCCAGTVFVALIVPETKGKSLDEIQKMLGGNKNHPV